MDDFYTGGLMGFTPEGEPIVCRNYGRLNLAAMEAIVETAEEEEEEEDGASKRGVMAVFDRAHIWEMEWFKDLLRAQSYKHGRHVKGVVVLDLQGISMTQFSTSAMAMIKKILTDDAAHYPDSLRKLYIVNAPGLFSFTWRIVKKSVHPITAAKISICRASETKAAMEEISAESCCHSKDTGGDAVPIEGVTNRSCLLPFGGWRSRPVNEADEWKWDAITRDIRVAKEAIQTGGRGERGGRGGGGDEERGGGGEKEGEERGGGERQRQRGGGGGRVEIAGLAAVSEHQAGDHQAGDHQAEVSPAKRKRAALTAQPAMRKKGPPAATSMTKPAAQGVGIGRLLSNLSAPASPAFPEIPPTFHEEQEDLLEIVKLLIAMLFVAAAAMTAQTLSPVRV